MEERNLENKHVYLSLADRELEGNWPPQVSQLFYNNTDHAP